MPSRRPPSQRDSQFMLDRTAAAVRQRVPGTGKVANAAPADLSGAASARAGMRGAPGVARVPSWQHDVAILTEPPSADTPLTFVPVPDSEQVFLNGLKLRINTEYIVVGAAVRLTDSVELTATDLVDVDYQHYGVVVAPTSSSTLFAYTGGVQTFIVPSGITSLVVECWGAEGGTFRRGALIGSAAGLGGYVKTTIPVTAGETLSVYVGGRGGDAPGTPSAGGGYNGGGAGGSGKNGSGGGGASDVRRGSTRLVVAGGGGGEGGSDSHIGAFAAGGAGGGLTAPAGGNGTAAGSTGGGGGSQTAVGAAGAQSSGTAAASGVGSTGGAGGAGVGGTPLGAGGGGGGYFGGGGGGGGGQYLGVNENVTGSVNGVSSSGGGGGSSYSAATISSIAAGVRNGDGQVRVSW